MVPYPVSLLNDGQQQIQRLALALSCLGSPLLRFVHFVRVSLFAFEKEVTGDSGVQISKSTSGDPRRKRGSICRAHTTI
jgi:hypothetical protein